MPFRQQFYSTPNKVGDKKLSISQLVQSIFCLYLGCLLNLRIPLESYTRNLSLKLRILKLEIELKLVMKAWLQWTQWQNFCFIQKELYWMLTMVHKALFQTASEQSRSINLFLSRIFGKFLENVIFQLMWTLGPLLNLHNLTEESDHSRQFLRGTSWKLWV